MNILRPMNDARLTRSGIGLALAPAVTYVITDSHVHAVGDLKLASDGDIIMYVAAGGHALERILILARGCWRWMTGALITPLVIISLFRLYASRPEFVLFLAGGIIAEAAQVLLEFALMYLLLRKPAYKVKGCSTLLTASGRRNAKQ